LSTSTSPRRRWSAASARTQRPTVAELRAVAQPARIFERNSGEHWAGKLYVRRYSIYLTRLLLPTRVTPNAVTWGMIVLGVLAAAALTVPGLWGAIAAFVLIQGQILLDCSDGELARWRQQSSPVGIYLDRFAHYFTESLLPIALGIRADGGWDSLGGYTMLGLVAAVLALLVRTESALVAVARLESGRGAAADTAAVAAPRASGLARVRRALGFFPFFRAFVAIEATLLALAAAIGDAFVDGIPFTRGLVIALVPVAAITAAGHLLAILNSSRLR
jgi:phosphatidylglycerophosphate synthase